MDSILKLGLYSIIIIEEFGASIINEGPAMNILLLSLSLLASTITDSMDDRSGTLTLQDAFGAINIAGPSIESVSFSPDSKWVVYLRRSATKSEGASLFVTSTVTNESILIATSERLAKAATARSDANLARQERQRNTGALVSNIIWHPNSDQLMVSIGDRLLVASLFQGELVPLDLPKEAGEAIVDAQYSPDGRYISFVGDGVLKLFDLSTYELTMVSEPATEFVRHGVAEYIAQEEMARDRGYWWAPDSKAIAFTTVDDTQLTPVKSLALQTIDLTVREQLFPFTGQQNSRISLSVWHSETGKTNRLNWNEDKDFYLARVNWSLSSEELYFQRLSRNQQSLDLVAADPDTGALTVILTEAREPWIELNQDFTPIENGDFFWVSEKTGYQHAYLFTADNKTLQAITRGNFPLGGVFRRPSIVGRDKLNEKVFFIASPGDATQMHLFSASIKNPNEWKMITKTKGWWDIQMSANGQYFIGTHSNQQSPPKTGLFSSDGGLIRWISENIINEDHPYYALKEGHPVAQFGHLKAADGQELDYVLKLPSGLKKSVKVPAILKVYGGPGAQRVKNQWPSNEDRLWLEAGYALMQVDNRGSGNRGLAFQKPVWRAKERPEVADQLVAVDFLRSHPSIDENRLGVMGWSYGGYMTLLLMTEEGSGLKAGSAGAAPADWRGYDTFYTEKYFGLPTREKDVYDAVAILPRLDRLHGDLLLLHGLSDDNVHINNILKMSAKLQSQSKRFDLMLYPGQAHVITGSAYRKHMWLTQKDFFDRTVKFQP